MNFADCVQERTATTGTGALTLIGATPGNRTFAAAVAAGDLADGDTVTIRIESANRLLWEVCESVYTAPSTLSRGTVRASSAAGARVAFTGVSKVSLVESATSIVDVSAPSVAAQSQTAWFIDPDNGDDRADGSTDETPIRSQPEYMRRTGGVINASTTVTILSSTTAQWAWHVRPTRPGLTFTLRGRISAPLFEGTISGAVNWAASTETVGQFTASDLPVSWTASDLVGKQIVLTSGANVGMTSWVNADLTGKAARVDPLCLTLEDFGTTGALTDGDTFKVVDLPVALTGTQTFDADGDVNCVVRDLFIGDINGGHHQSFVRSGSWAFWQCRVVAVDTHREATTAFIGCRYAHFRLMAGGNAFLYRTSFDLTAGVWQGFVELSDCYSTCASGFFVGGLGLGASFGIHASVYGTAIGFASLDASSWYGMTVGSFAHLDLTDGYLWGAGNLFGLLLWPEAKAIVNPAKPMKPMSATNEINLGNTIMTVAEALGALPAVSASGASIRTGMIL